jgi:hypothetical protein
MNTCAHVSVRIPADLVERLREEAVGLDRSLSWVIRQRLGEAMNIPAVPRRVEAERPAPSTSRPVEPALTVNPDRVAVKRKPPVSVLPPAAVETAVNVGSGGGGWYPRSRCPHDYVNSFACRKAGGGC